MANESPREPIYLIDASIYIFRAYFAIPDEWFSPQDDPINALYGYAQFLFNFLQRVKPEHIVVAHDESLGSCFRNDIYPEYKISRALPDDALAFQLEACKALTELMAIPTLASDRYEADDIIATAAWHAQAAGQPVVIVTRDKDLGQLLTVDDYIWDFSADKKISSSDFQQHFGVRPDQFVDYLALVGDSIDDIPGVPGIGKKTAAGLLQQFGSISAMMENPVAIAGSGLRGANRLADKLSQHREQIVIAQQLAALATVPELNWIDYRWDHPDPDDVRCFLEEFGLGVRFKRQLDSAYWCAVKVQESR